MTVRDVQPTLFEVTVTGTAPGTYVTVEVSSLSRHALVRLVNCFCVLLPASERSRFVAEAQGNLGDCERWWQRVDQLVGLAVGMPRLAWMMWRNYSGAVSPPDLVLGAAQGL